MDQVLKDIKLLLKVPEGNDKTTNALQKYMHRTRRCVYNIHQPFEGQHSVLARSLYICDTLHASSTPCVRPREQAMQGGGLFLCPMRKLAVRYQHANVCQ